MIERLSSREVFANPWLRVREDAVRYPDGAESTYTVLERADFTVVLARQDDGFWLVEQDRYPVGERLWELPQGAWPHGRTGTPLELARAELAEETGVRAATWTHLGRLATNPGISSQRYDVWLAEDLTIGEPDREESERDMAHRWFSRAELHSMIRDGLLIDDHTLAALLLLDLHGDLHA